MIQSITILESLDSAAIEPYSTLRRQQMHRENGWFVAEGHKVVERLIASPLIILSVLLTQGWLEKFRSFLEVRPEPIDVFIGKAKLLETITGYHLHQHIMALAVVPGGSTIETVLATSLGTAPLLVALDSLTSADNTGLIIRNCAGCGANALVVGETSADPYLRRAVRKSMGTIIGLHVIYASSLADTIRDLRTTRHFRVFAAHPRPDSVPLYKTDLRGSSCIVFGSEGKGVSEEVLRECDAAVTIPMEDDFDSFNVACASAIMLYEVMRQRCLCKAP